MSAAASQYDRFKRQIVQDDKVFTFTNEDEYLVYKIRDQEVVPFWSSRTRMVTIQKGFPKYRPYEIKEMSLAEFVRWLPELEEEGIHIGANWSGKRLVGYDVAVKDLLAGLKFLMSRQTED